MQSYTQFINIVCLSYCVKINAGKGLIFGSWTLYLSFGTRVEVNILHNIKVYIPIELYVEGTPTPINSPIIAHQRHNTTNVKNMYLHRDSNPGPWNTIQVAPSPVMRPTYTYRCQTAGFPISHVKLQLTVNSVISQKVQ